MSADTEQLWVTRLLDAGRTLVAELDEEAVLTRVLDVAREATGARYAAIGILDQAREELDRFLAIGLDAETSAAIGDPPRGRGVLGELIREGRPLRLADVAAHPRSHGFPPGHPSMHTFLGVPIVIREQAWGNLYLAEKQGGEQFTAADEQAAVMLAEWAAVAIVNARNARSQRLRSALAAADAERRRWARELHDETLQALSGMRLLLTSALRSGDASKIAAAATSAVGHVEREILNLRSIISELRPAALDELGLTDAIAALVEQHVDRSCLKIEADIRLGERCEPQRRLDPELEIGIYRLIQEALTNVAKHAQASTVQLVVHEQDDEVRIEVRDDGVGFSPETAKEGFGLLGMRERTRLADGSLNIVSGQAGTVVRARLSTRLQAMPQLEPVDAQIASRCAAARPAHSS